MSLTYDEFLARKVPSASACGFEPQPFAQPLFDFQADAVKWACRRGRSALFEDCGLGKTPQQLVWADQVVKQTSNPVLILAPNEVAHQTVREGDKFGLHVHHVRDGADIVPGINITNYERLHRFDPSVFGGIVLDESSILKAYDGKTRTHIINSFESTRYKLACTATPAPNDFMELGNHSEFLGVMTRAEMLATFFVHDGGDTSKWRLKQHAVNAFWRWLCTWAVNIRTPSDLGYDNTRFTLPPLRMHEHIVHTSAKVDGYLFPLPASSLKERRDARRASLNERVALAADMVTANSREQWVCWCNLNSESEALADAVSGVEVRGSTTEQDRERIARDFLNGNIQVVVTKPSLWGFGMNLQCCHNTAFVGLSDSYEEFYQCVRRFWRFGQTREVNAHIIISELEGAVLANIKRKEADACRLAQEMVAHMSQFSKSIIRGATRDTEDYTPAARMALPAFL